MTEHRHHACDRCDKVMDAWHPDAEVDLKLYGHGDVDTPPGVSWISMSTSDGEYVCTGLDLCLGCLTWIVGALKPLEEWHSGSCSSAR